jgi:aspartyl-tRNA(Asn)/glutamyl-tRNA(Gln) amidotransferase subunit C
MAESINKHELEHLAKLARIELDPKEEEKLLKDLGNMLEHFKELQNLPTKDVTPMAGGTDLKNIFREDTERENTNRGAGVEAFPEKEKGFLKIPPVFDAGA